MVTQKSRATVTGPPKVNGVCEHCLQPGLIGPDILPYSFENLGERHWCHRACMPLAYAAWRAKQ